MINAQKTLVYITDQKWFSRMLDVLPGLVTWIFLLAPIWLSLIHPVWVAYFIIAFDLFWVIKAFRLSTFLVRGYHKLHVAEKLDWAERLKWLDDPDAYLKKSEQNLKAQLTRYPNSKRFFQFTSTGVKQHNKYRQIVADIKELREIKERRTAIISPDKLFNVVILATYNESLEIVESSIKSVLDCDYNHKQLMLYIAYEERGGKQTEENAKHLIKKYGSKFAHAEAISHPDGIKGEVIGKGGNITYAGRRLTEYVINQGIDPEYVIVTTLDADNRPAKQYFSQLSYAYAINPNRVHKSFQPIPMFYNNIWDAPAPMRVIATGNSYWLIMETMRPHRLRNFAAHAQSLRALIDTDYWSVTTIVEDGHQFWRSYFTFDGDHQVIPIYVPIYQDAVLDETYLKTFRAQYVQLRRWAWGVSDFSYVVRNSIRNNRIPLIDKIVQNWRQFEGHFSWSTSALIITFVAWLPLFLNHDFSNQVLAHQLPIIASRLMNVALVSLVAMISVSMISLPPRPARYGNRRHVGMLLQWALLPVTSIAFSAFAAIEAQTRLMIGKSLNFEVTPKKRKAAAEAEATQA